MSKNQHSPSPAQEPKETSVAQEPKAAPKGEESAKQQFDGKLVKKLRDATSADPNWMEGTDQVVITLDDGTERTVRRNELTEVPK